MLSVCILWEIWICSIPASRGQQLWIYSNMPLSAAPYLVKRIASYQNWVKQSTCRSKLWEFHSLCIILLSTERPANMKDDPSLDRFISATFSLRSGLTFSPFNLVTQRHRPSKTLIHGGSLRPVVYIFIPLFPLTHPIIQTLFVLLYGKSKIISFFVYNIICSFDILSSRFSIVPTRSWRRVVLGHSGSRDALPMRV